MWRQAESNRHSSRALLCSYRVESLSEAFSSFRSSLLPTAFQLPPNCRERCPARCVIHQSSTLTNLIPNHPFELNNPT
nr:MAG TPA: hypothetical protein [Caudoviricetes sp.]